MARPKVVMVLALVVCGALLFGASRLVPGINAGRQSLNMYGSQDVLENAPSEYAVYIQAFGAFRSLIVNLAFIRAETYKEEGRYYDAMQLATWICRLQPRFPSVWEFQAWNMAWNISVTTFTPEERWNWVYNGVRLLRDEGITKYNPRAVNLYKQLAWIFNNKMGENLDDFHWEYKRNWAWRMHLVLGPRPLALGQFQPDKDTTAALFDVADDPLLEAARVIARQQEERRRQRTEELGVPYRTSKPLEERLKELPLNAPEAGAVTPADLAKRAVRDYVQSIADAPASLAQLFGQYPETREMVAQLHELGAIINDDTLDEDSYWYAGKLAATFFARYRRLVDTPSLRATIARGEEKPSEEDQALARFDQIVGVRAGRPAGQALVRFLQRKVLKEVYKLDPARMVSLVDHFGPLDWRQVDAQSLYWVTQGLLEGGETVTSFENDKTNTARILFFSLRNLFLRNNMTFEPYPQDILKSYINFAPDVDFIEPMHRAFITYGPMIDPDPGDAANSGEIFRSGHVNFLKEAIRMLWFSDRLPEAEKYYEYLRTHYSTRPDGSIETRYQQPLQDFVIASFYPNADSPRETERIISDLLHRAYSDLANENVDAYQQYVSKALDFYQTYARERKNSAGQRMQLKPFQDYQIDVFRNWFMVQPVYSAITIRKAHLWRVAPPVLKQWVYDDLAEGLARECDVWDFDVTKAFPAPPDMDAFRQAHPQRTVERRQPDAETVPQP